MTTLTHPTLIDPATNEPLEALGFRANGTPIWPMIGGSDDDTGIPDMPEDDDEDEGDDTQDSDDSDDSKEKPKPKAPVKKKTDDKDEDDEEADPDSPMKLRDARRLRRENQQLRAAKKLADEEREELEKLREEKLSEKEKLENRAKRGETTAAEYQAQLEEARLRLALGLPEPDEDSDDDEDPFDDVPLKGASYEEKLANARKFAKRYKIGRYAEKDDSQEEKPANRSRKTPPPKDLKGQRGTDEDSEDDPVKLADRMVKSKFGL